MPEFYSQDSRLTKVGSTVIPFTRNVRTQYENDPPKVSGAWISFGDGSRFRQTTNYSRAGYSLERHAPEKMQGRRVSSNQVWTVGTSPGGLLYNYASGSWLTRFSSYGIPTLAGSPDILTFDRNQANAKSLSEIADGKAQMGENLATMAQTARLVINPAQGLLSAFNRFRADKSLWPLVKLSYRDIIRGKTSERVASAYLQYVYGVAPLMQDVHGVMSMLKEQGIKPLFLSGKGKSESASRPSDIHQKNISANRDEYLEQLEYATRTKSVLWAKLNPEWQALRALNQLGLLNPASIAWELVPFSFLIDWFIPIGSMLGALSAPAGLDFVGGSISRTAAIAGSIRNSEYAPSADWKIASQTPATGTLLYKGYRRERVTNWPVVGFYYDKDPLGLSRDGSDRILKAIALATLRLPRL